MSDELNEVTTEPEAVESVVTDQATEGERVAEATTTEPEPASAGYEKRISTLTARNFHKDTELQQLKAENQTLKALKEKPVEVSAPELPDEDLRFEDEAAYRQKVSEYHKAVAAEAVKDAQRNQESQRVASEEQKAVKVKQDRHNEIVTGYVDGGIKAGISEVKMQANEQVLAIHQLPQDLAEFIYSDSDGAKIVDFLADNPEKIQELKNSGSGHAFIKLANEIKPQALSKKPAHTNAPDPISPTRGAGSAPTDGVSPLLQGATFE
jgi:hypothetical protein